ncbi:MAG: restriction endonuclease subunit S [Acidimicrobiales bacterium]
MTIGVRSFGKGIFHYEPKPGNQLGSLRFFELPPDRLVISNIKGWEGAVAVSSILDADCLASNRFLTYVPIDNRIDVGWARWYFLSESGLELIQRASPGSADRNRTLAIDRFEGLEIPLPPVEEQLSAADYLDRMRAGAVDLERRSDHREILSNALAVSLAARPDLGVDAKSRKGWRRVALGEVMKPASNVVTVDSEKSYPNLGIYSYGRGLFAKPSIEGSRTSAKILNRIHADQFIYSRLFAFEGAYACVERQFDGNFVSNEFPAFDPNPEQLDAKWLATYLRSPERWAELGGSSKGLGVRRQRIPIEALLAYEVWLPSMEEQRRMVQRIEGLEQAQADRSSVGARIRSLVPAALNEAFADLG